MRFNLPPSRAGLRVGILGGSFDPAHEGHVKISLQALKQFDLDQVWWLVSPGNPLKNDGPAALDQRVKFAREEVYHPKVKVTKIETYLQTNYTCDTLDALKALYPKTKFIWLMGADNMAQMHLWKDWKHIFEIMPVGVLARPGQSLPARCSVAARHFVRGRISSDASQAL
ncbi:MAG: nicotinate-nucleotide adenylyltransferase, partial [Planktomarina sp.]|nr:nicotinate-nucleotide adenylyltransferase [Planktomarina sp.]